PAVVTAADAAPSSTRNVAVAALEKLGEVPTRRLAALLAMLPEQLVKTARYCVPLSGWAAVNCSMVAVSPTRSEKVTPSSVDCCHCTVGAGCPVAVTEKTTGLPAPAVTSAGCAVIVGASVTTSSKAWVVAGATPFVAVNTRLYTPPLPASAVPERTPPPAVN